MLLTNYSYLPNEIHKSTLSIPGLAAHFGFAVRAEFRIRAAQQAAGIFGIVFEVEPFKSRVEMRFRTRYGGGGRRGWRARMQGRALQDSVLKIGRSPRFLGAGAIPVANFLRARLAALCGMWTGDMHRFSSSCGHEQGVKLYRKSVQTIFDLFLQMRSFWRAGRPRRAETGLFGISAAPLPAAGIPARP
jgi:hypothetical protein